jgi:hypothetical protein
MLKSLAVLLAHIRMAIQPQLSIQQVYLLTQPLALIQ